MTSDFYASSLAIDFAPGDVPLLVMGGAPYDGFGSPLRLLFGTR